MEFKCTMLIEARKIGKSESFFTDVASLEAARTKLKALIDVRKDLLSAQGSVVGYRVTQVGVRGPSISDDIQGTGTSLPTADTGTRDVPQSCLLVRLNAAGGYKRSYYLHGAPDVWQEYTDDGKKDDPSAQFRKQLKRLINKLANDGWQLQVISADPADTGAQPITDIQNPQAQTVVYSAPGHPFTLGQRVKIVGLKGVNVKQFGGLRRIIAVNAGVTFTAHQDTVSLPFQYEGDGQALRRVTTYKNILPYQTDTTFGSSLQRFTSKKTGRAFFVSAGRRKKRASSQ